jgi:hypothetical protein
VPLALLEPSEPAPMLRLVPLGWLGAGLDGAGLEGAGLDGAGLDGAGLDGRGDEGAGDGEVGVQLPFETCRPLLAPAVAAMTLGTQLAPSAVNE